MQYIYAVLIAQYYINLGREKAYQTSRNYYCEPGAITNKAIAQFESDVWTERDSANAAIAAEKANKEQQYWDYQALLAWLASHGASGGRLIDSVDLCSSNIVNYVCKRDSNSSSGYSYNLDVYRGINVILDLVIGVLLDATNQIFVPAANPVLGIIAGAVTAFVLSYLSSQFKPTVKYQTYQFFGV
ncbi:MAG: hypothetical protein LBB10_01895 [Bifidobacteriaceae bacterium]|nr:hypothetical protein [Bifidobacteriaceae bacterium]